MTRAPASRRLSGLSTRLLAAQALLLLAGAGTSWVVASLIGPGIFHYHLAQAGGDHTSAELEHADLAFQDALIVSTGVALVVSVAVALSVTAWFSRRVQRSTRAVVGAARRISAGQYAVRVPPTGLGSELDLIGDTVNALAERLEETETTRQRLLSDLGHEMRTPLATIEMHLEAVEDGVRPLDATTIEVLRSSTGRLRRLAEDISAVSRAQEGRLDLVVAEEDLAELARRSVTAAAPAYEEAGTRLRLDAPRPVHVVVDGQRIAQLLANLLSNALRHTPSGGNVTVRVDRSADGAVLEVTDDGEGIDARDLPHVLERFYRGDQSRSRRLAGTGIGLTISAAIADAHGGTLRAESDGPGRGARLVLELPARAAPTTPSPNLHESDTAATGSGRDAGGIG